MRAMQAWTPPQAREQAPLPLRDAHSSPTHTTTATELGSRAGHTWGQETARSRTAGHPKTLLCSPHLVLEAPTCSSWGPRGFLSP